MRITLDINREASVKGDMRALYSSIMMTQDGSDINDVLNEMRSEFLQEYPDADITLIMPGEVEDYYAGLNIAGIPLDGQVDIQKDGNKITLKIPVNKLENGLLQIAGGDSTQEIPEAALLKSYGFDGMLVVNMPAKPQSNAGVIEKNTVTIDLLDLPEDIEEIVITCSVLNVPVIIGASLGALLVIGGVVYGITRRKQKDA